MLVNHNCSVSDWNTRGDFPLLITFSQLSATFSNQRFVANEVAVSQKVRFSSRPKSFTFSDDIFLGNDAWRVHLLLP